jgi:hypothetical protein
MSPSTQRKEVIQCLTPSAVTSLGSPARLFYGFATGRSQRLTSECKSWGATGAIPPRLFCFVIPRCAIAHLRARVSANPGHRHFRDAPSVGHCRAEATGLRCAIAHRGIIAHETAGASGARHSLRPRFREGGKLLANLGRMARRECELTSWRHCERSEAIHSSSFAPRDGLLRCARNDDFKTLHLAV